MNQFAISHKFVINHVASGTRPIALVEISKPANKHTDQRDTDTQTNRNTDTRAHRQIDTQTGLLPD